MGSIMIWIRASLW